MLPALGAVPPPVLQSPQASLYMPSQVVMAATERVVPLEETSKRCRQCTTANSPEPSLFPM